jgi:hypothetical protein
MGESREITTYDRWGRPRLYTVERTNTPQRRIPRLLSAIRDDPMGWDVDLRVNRWDEDPVPPKEEIERTWTVRSSPDKWGDFQGFHQVDVTTTVDIPGVTVTRRLYATPEQVQQDFRIPRRGLFVKVDPVNP